MPSAEAILLQLEMSHMQMRLWLGLVVEGVADRFAISVGAYSEVFLTWMNVTAQEMKVNLHRHPKNG